MVVLWAAVALAVVFLIAAVAIGREASRLAAAPPRPVFDLEEAVIWIADRLPFEVAAELSHDDVRRILQWSLEHFRSKGVTGNGSSADAPARDVVVAGAETVSHLLSQAREAGMPLSAEQVHAVLEAEMDYLEAIGAAGPAGEVPPPTGADPA